jgi:putative SOS response-associated peptidase YedK
MDGFFEWKAVPGQKAKQPMFIHRPDRAPLAAAGLWSVWRDKALGPDAPWLHSCTIITTAANATMAPVHDRMPALLDRADWQTWLDADQHDLEALARLLKPAPDDLLVLPWNLLDEVRAENSALADAGTRFVVAVPRMKVS